MKKFQTGKRYTAGAMVYEITKRTEKTITFKEIQHAGRFNERITKEGTKKLYSWPGREVFCPDGIETVEA